MADNITGQPHVKEAQMANALNNLTNAVTSDTTNLANLAMTKSKLAEQLKVALAQKVLP